MTGLLGCTSTCCTKDHQIPMYYWKEPRCLGYRESTQNRDKSWKDAVGQPISLEINPGQPLLRTLRIMAKPMLDKSPFGIQCRQ